MEKFATTALAVDKNKNWFSRPFKIMRIVQNTEYRSL